MDAQRRAASGKPSIASATKKRGIGSDAPGSSARGSEDRSSVAPPPPPRGLKRGREIEGIDKVRFFVVMILLAVPELCAIAFYAIFFAAKAHSNKMMASHAWMLTSLYGLRVI